MIKAFLYLILMVGGISSCSSEKHSSDTGATDSAVTVTADTAGIHFISGKEASALLDHRQGIVLLDVRTQKEYDAGHAKDALHIDFHSPQFSQHLQALDPGKSYVVYCAVGGRSKKAVAIMEEMGFKQLYEVSEGYSGLKNAGVPVVEDPERSTQ